MNSTDKTKKYPVIYGYEYEAEIFNHDGMKQWNTYFEMEQLVFSTECLVYDEEEDFIYYITTQVQKVNPATGQIQILGTVPESLERPGKCAISNSGQVKGIVINLGFLFNLNTFEWESIQPPPLHPWSTTSSSGIWSYQGAPTIFGQPICDINKNCPAVGIMQYRAEIDEWVKLGEFRLPRTYATVIEVPQKFCDVILDPSLTTTPSMTTTDTTDDTDKTTDMTYATTDMTYATTDKTYATSDMTYATTDATDKPTTDPNTAPTMTTPTSDGRPNVAFIIGGVSSIGSNRQNYVELFGCPGSEDNTIEVVPFPRDVYLTAGTFVNREGGHVVACGGDQSIQGIGGIARNCYDFRPGDDAWQVRYEPLNTDRLGHMMEMMVDLNDPTGSETLYPVVYGYSNMSEIYDYDTKEWKDYREMEDILFSFDCLAENPKDGNYYSIRYNCAYFNLFTY